MRRFTSHLLFGLLSAHLTLLGQGAFDAGVPPGNFDVPALVMALRNPLSGPATCADLRQFLDRDDSNLHRYQEGVYDCRHFSLELFRRAQKERIACFMTLVDFAETPIGHSVVEFPTQDKGTVFVDFTPAFSGTNQVDVKGLSMLAMGLPRIQMPLSQVPSDFTNNVAIFQSYLLMQEMLQQAKTVLATRPEEMNRTEPSLKGKMTSANAHDQDSRERAHAQQRDRYNDALQALRRYEECWKSPFDLQTRMTVTGLRRF